MNTKTCLLLGALCGVFDVSQAACPDAADVLRYVADFAAARPSKGFGNDISLSDAACAREKLTQVLPVILGERVGYKALFTNAESQRRFGVSGPAWGVMFGGTMHDSGVRMPANFGAKPRYEADFVVIVKDAGLADASTPLEALKHISALVPFVELPDLMLDGSLRGADLIATNAAYRGGVLGTRIPVEAGQEAMLLESLGNMEVIVTELRSGKEIGRAKGNVLMDNPVNAAMWLAKTLKQEGVPLKAGDLLSLGGFLASTPTRPATSMSIRYQGLPGNPAVLVHFD